MRKTRIAAIGTVGIVAALALAGCASSGGGSSSPAATNGANNSKGKTLTVWAMTGDLSTPTLDAINKEFTKETGAKVNIQTQQWADITTKVTTALASSNPPDIIDIGNTQVASYGANGGLADLTQYKSELEQGQTWLKGLVDPATIDGKLYAVPSFAGVRAVIYNKAVWKAAGVTAVPTTMAQLESDLNAVKAKNPSADYSAFYLPGQYWYGALQWIWDAGGTVASQQGGKWVSNMSTPKDMAGLNAWKKFQNTYSSVGSRTLNTDKPDQGQVFANGDASAILGTTTDLANITKDNPKLQPADLGTFPMPSASGSGNQPVMTGGSVWGIPAKSSQQSLAREWIKIATSPSIQKTWVGLHDGWQPNSQEASQAVASDSSLAPNLAAFYTAAQNSKATPASPNWAPLETTDVLQFLQSVASGSATPAAAAKSWDNTVNTALNK